MRSLISIIIAWAALFSGNVSTGQTVQYLHSDWVWVNATNEILLEKLWTLNGHTFPYWTVTSIKPTIAYASFPTDWLFVGGGNVFSGGEKMRFSGTGYIRITNTLNKGTSRERILCSLVYQFGNPSPEYCNVQFSLSIYEIDPSLASALNWYRAEEQRMTREILRLRNEKPSVSELEAAVKHLSELDLDHLTPDQLTAVSKEFKRVAEILSSFKKSIEALRKELADQTRNVGDELRNLHDLTQNEIKTAGIKDEKDGGYRDYQIDELRLPQIDIPAVGTGEPLDIQHNVYATFADSTLARLTDALRKRDRVGFNLILESWTETSTQIAKILPQRSGGTSTNEFRAFNAASKRVLTFAQSQVDRFGFFNDAPIPQDIKLSIERDIGESELGRARRLRDRLNEWSPEKLTLQQEQMLQVVRGIGKGFQALHNIVDAGGQARKVLNEILDSAIEGARVGARIGIAFTPAHVFVDFCELLTGRELCTPQGRELSTLERAGSAAGVLIGSYAFWQEFGHLFTGEVSIAEASAAVAKWNVKVDAKVTSDPELFKMFASSARPAKPGNKVLTRAGYKLTQHSLHAGFANANEMRKIYRRDAEINDLASEILGKILSEGIRGKELGLGPKMGPNIQIFLPTGLGAAFHSETKEFITFIGVPK